MIEIQLELPLEEAGERRYLLPLHMALTRAIGWVEAAYEEVEYESIHEKELTKQMIKQARILLEITRDECLKERNALPRHP